MFEVLWTTHKGQPLIHRNEFSKHNKVKQHVAFNDQVPRSRAWRNADLTLRNWWQDQIESEYLLVLEWDVYINQKINIIFQPGATFQSIKRKGDPWDWWGDSLAFPMEPVGVVPLAVALYDRASLNKACDPKYDEYFKKNLFSELRWGTILNHAGGPLHKFNIPTITYNPTKVKGRGIFHSVKTRQI